MNKHDHESRESGGVERVALRSRPRPRRRRRPIRGGALLAAAVVIGGVVTGCGSGDDSPVDSPVDSAADDGASATSGGAGEGSISVTDSSGTVRALAADELAVGCTSEGGKQQLVLSRSDLLPGILDGDPIAVSSLDDGPFPVIRVDVDVVPVGEELTLPLDDTLDDTLDDVVLLYFVVDDGGSRANELSSDRPDASGTVVVQEASCDAEPRLELTVDALLGSAVGQASLPMEGTYRFS